MAGGVEKKVLGDKLKLIFMDETTVRLDPRLRAGWMKIGPQKRIPATRPGEKQKRHIFGGYH